MKPLHGLAKNSIRKLLAVAMMTCLVACIPKTSPYLAAQGIPDSLANDGPIENVPMADTEGTQPQSYYCSSPVSDPHDLRAKALIGKLIPDLEDSTLLAFVYGDFDHASEGYSHDAGPTMFDEDESFSMEVAEQLGNDSLQLVYLRGEKAITTVSHNFFQESCLMLKLTSQGWKVLDAYVDAESIDFHAVDIAGEYNGSFILKYETAGVYAGGVSYGSLQFRWLNPSLLQGPSIEFMTESSNDASMQCFEYEGDPETDCDCYSRTGTIKFNYDKEMNCLVFDYHYENTDGDCEMKDPKITTANQVWYMNADTAFQAKGPILGEWADGITGKVNMSKAEIQKRLNMK